jgi:2-C-methyl-D-erythritol 4-phosphate cytidylyltransferase/2-C-methyl-D-erythritol 2,4-cyclodiphosphate synthase
MKIFVIICAAGTGDRFNTNTSPKQFLKLNNKSVLEHSIDKFLSSSLIDRIIIASNSDHNIYLNTIKERYIDTNKIDIISGGKTRIESVFNGLRHIEKSNPDLVFVHDAARPNFDTKLIKELVEAIEGFDCVIPVSRINDTIKKINNSTINTLDRSNLFSTQTPQIFKFKMLIKAHKTLQLSEIKENITDDAQIMELFKNKINTYINSSDNFKITTEDDFNLLKKILSYDMIKNRVGIGFDVHKFDAGEFIRIFGINIPFNKSLKGHSDADVGLHSITDAIYGSLGLEDIGYYFNPNDKKWKDADSTVFLDDALEKLEKANAKIINLDIVVICEEPKINPYRIEIKKKLADLLNIDSSQISIKGTTTEELGFTGRKEGIAVQTIVNVSSSE